MATPQIPVSQFVVCGECDALQKLQSLARGQLLACYQCGARLGASGSEHLHRVLPLTIAAGICFVLANSYPMVAIEVAGNRASTSLIGAIVELYRQGVPGVALLVLLTGVMAPAAQIVLLAYAFWLRAAPRRLPGLSPSVRLLHHIRPWSMAEVFMLGALVSLVKLAGVARVIPGIGMWALFAVIFLTAAAEAAFDVKGYWKQSRGDRMSGTERARCVSASALGVIGCPVCGQLNRRAWSEGACWYCEAPLQHRKRESLSRSWAYLLSAVIMYIPANLYPVLQSRTVAGDESHTIMGGVVALWRGGSWPLALLVFFASIVVPLLKLLAMTLLLVSVHARWSWRLRERAHLYRLVEFVGRWSMLDIFVVAILVALVRLRSLATMDAGPGALAFGAVVVLSMLAAQSFDVRLLWDSAGRNEHTRPA